MTLSYEKLPELAAYWALKVFLAILIFYLGRKLSRSLSNFIARKMSDQGVDEILVKLSRNTCYMALLALVALAALSQLGVDTTSALAVFGAAGLAVGLALKDSLSNFAAGVMIAFFKPFRLGHYVEAAGTAGTVQLVDMFNTTMLTPDNKRVIVPNRLIYNDTIVNYSAEATRRLDLVVGIAYDDDIRRAVGIIEEILRRDDRVLKEPAPTVVVGELGDSSVNINVRPWLHQEDYWAVRAHLLEGIKTAFDEADISIPFPQQEVYMHTMKQATG